MTNYEWLCTEAKLWEFLKDYKNMAVCDFVSKYKIPFQHEPDGIVKWLRLEHIDANKWVRLADLMVVIDSADVFSNFLSDTRREIYSEIRRLVLRLETKEIEE